MTAGYILLRALTIILIVTIPTYYTGEITRDIMAKHVYPQRTKEALIKVTFAAVAVAAIFAYTWYIPFNDYVLSWLTGN